MTMYLYVAILKHIKTLYHNNFSIVLPIYHVKAQTCLTPNRNSMAYNLNNEHVQQNHNQSCHKRQIYCPIGH